MTSLSTDQTYQAPTSAAASTSAPAIRWSKIMDAKAAIRAGQYDDPAELDELIDGCLSAIPIDLAE